MADPKARKLILHVEVDEFHGSAEQMWKLYREYADQDAPLVDALLDGDVIASGQIIVAFQACDGDSPSVPVATVGRLVGASLAERPTPIRPAPSTPTEEKEAPRG